RGESGHADVKARLVFLPDRIGRTDFAELEHGRVEKNDVDVMMERGRGSHGRFELAKGASAHGSDRLRCTRLAQKEEADRDEQAVEDEQFLTKLIAAQP